MPIIVSLRTRLIGIFAAMALIVVVCCCAMLWHTYQVNNMLEQVIEKDLVLHKIAQEMELALANQKGFLTYYFVDGNDKWLQSIEKYKKLFRENLDRALTLKLDKSQEETLGRISREYRYYRQEKISAINTYKAALNSGNISGPHEKQRDFFFNVLDLCKKFSADQWQMILRKEQAAEEQSKRLRMIAYSSLTVFSLLCAIFLYILYKHILGPIRDLAIETGSTPQESSMDEVVSLSHSLKGMMRDFGKTHDELEKSRRSLLQAERMAVVGELAAGVAHTIRNPFTSIKMRMFSLSRSLNLSALQNEDLQVISDEIDRIDKIVINFIEFARPPKLKLEPCCVGELIRSVVTLLEYRLKHYKTEIIYDFQPDLAKVHVDSDRIREALLNIITNSCESMDDGGKIYIKLSCERDKELGNAAVISIKDTGPGIEESILHKVTAPFFTTKEDGSGLGLSIVARIVREHKGRLIILPSDQGAEIEIRLPV